MKKAFLFLITAIVLVGCSSNEPIAPVNEQNSDTLSPYTEIIERANWYYSQLNKETRSASPKVRNIELLSNQATRSDVNDSIVNPIYYIVNYEDEAGFVMLGGNESAEPLAAISDEGNLSFSDTTNNPGLAAFINEISRPIIPILPVDSVIDMPLISLNVKPLLHSNVRKWGLGAPFNRGMPIIEESNVRAKINDTQLALLMAMTYHKWPNTTVSPDYNYDWEGIINTPTHPQIELILKLIGVPAGLNVTYGANKSTANPDNIANAAALMAYNCESYGKTLANFDVSSAEKIKSQLPLIMWGYKNSKLKSTRATWVIDGLLHVYHPENAETGESKQDKFYLHCVWGKYGRGNGYFLLDRLDHIGGNRYSKDSTDGTFEGYDDTNSVVEYKDNSFMYKIFPMPMMGI